MKEKIMKISIISVMVMLLLTGNVWATNSKAIEPEYTEIYKIWEGLSEEDKQGLIEPPKYVIDTQSKTNEETVMSNEQVSLKNLSKMLKASASAKEKKFSLKGLISKNLVIKDQKETNFCWAFAGISSLETNLAMKNYSNNVTEKIYDYSEKHMVYSMTNSFFTGQINSKGRSLKASDGGTYNMVSAYLTNGSGAINETELPFDNSQENIDISNIQGKKARTTVNDIKYFDYLYMTKNGPVSASGTALTNTELEDLKSQMKEHISTNGSIYAGIYFPSIDDTTYINLKEGTLNVAFESYNDIKTEMNKGSNGVVSNHAISIVGWDDDFDKTKFATQPKNNGAWIIRNSYGEVAEFDITEDRKLNSELTDEQLIAIYQNKYNMNCSIGEDKNTLLVEMGNKGFFYISYEDAYIYSDLMGVENADDSVTYDNLYQYDETGCTDAIYIQQSDVYMANKFTRTSKEDEYLTSIGFTSLVGGTYEVYINPNSSSKDLTKLQKAKLTTGSTITLTAGYHTIQLEKPYKLTGTDFVIVVKELKSSGDYEYISYEQPANNSNLTLSNAGESYIAVESFSKDSEWIDFGGTGVQISTEICKGSLGIKGIIVNNYTGEIANGTDLNEDTSGNTTNNTNTTNSTNTTNNTNTETNTSNSISGSESEASTPTNSNFDSVNISIRDMKVTMENIYIEFEMTGIQAEDNIDKYEHYFYITSNPNKTDIADSDWQKTKSFEKQANGKYSLIFEVTDISQINYENENDEHLYIYIKEVAHKNNKTSTKISNIELKIFTEGIDIAEDGKVEYTYTEENSGSSYIDKTTTNKSVLPYTGIKTIIAVIGIISIVFIIFYIKYKKLYDIK